MKQHTKHVHTHMDMHRAQDSTNLMWMLRMYVIYVQQFTTEVQSPLVYTITVLNSLHTQTANTTKGLISQAPLASGVTGDTVSNKVSMHP